MPRSWIVLLAASAACAPAPAPIEPTTVRAASTLDAPATSAPPVASEVPPEPKKPAKWTPEDALAANAVIRFPRRAVLAQSGPYALGVGTKGFGEEGPVARRIDVSVIEETDARLVVLFHDVDRTRLLFNGAPDRFAAVTADATALTRHGDLAPEPAARVVLGAGVVVVVKQNDGPALEVHATTTSFTIDGWVAASEVGRSFLPMTLPAVPLDKLEVVVDDDIDIVGPDRVAFAHVADGRTNARVAEELSIAAPAGYSAVRFVSPDVEIIGFVPRKSIKPLAGRLAGSHHAKPPRVRGMQAAVLAAEAPLFDDDGALIGRADREEVVFLSTAGPVVADENLRPIWISVDLFNLIVKVRGRDLRPEP